MTVTHFTLEDLHGAPRESVFPIEAHNLVFERAGRRILDNVSLRLDQPGITVLMGPNGAGKSVLLRVLADLLAPDSGQLRWGQSAPRRSQRTRIGFVFQKPVLFRRSALANVRHALHALGCARAHSAAKALDALAFAGLQHLAHAPARLLSGGEQQRLAIARAFALEPEVLFLDEPTANLDPAATAQIESMIRTTSARARHVVLVTHDVGQARRLAGQVEFMHHGRIVEAGPAQSFFNNPQSTPASAFLDGQIAI